MNFRNSVVSILLTAILLCALGGTAIATSVTFTDFSSTAGLAINGNAAQTTTGDGSVLRLTPATTGQSGSVFSQTSLNASAFSTFFMFRITNPGGIHDGTNTGADGLVFVTQSVSSSIGGSGGGIGYQGISNSVGVEFDTWHNGWDPDSNHLGIDTNGSVSSLATQAVSPRFDDGNIWFAWIDYDGTTLEVRLNQSGTRPGSALFSSAIDIPSLLLQSTGYVGFTAGTGSAYGNHDILAWEYRDYYNPIDGDGGTSVPEPGTMLLLGSGLMGLVGCGRRKFKK